jgi:hypothetical protein
MKIINGVAVFEEVPCWNCKIESKTSEVISPGKVSQGILCEFWGKTVRGKFPGGKCPVCGTKSKEGHKVIGNRVIDCPICEGKGTRTEDRFDFDTIGCWKELHIVIVRSEKPQSLAEAYLGVGLFSLTDYGAYKHKTDEEIVSDIHKDRSVQFSSYITKENQAADKLIVICNNNGYSVLPNFNKEGDHHGL